MKIKFILIAFNLSFLLACCQTGSVDYVTRTGFALNTEINIKLEKVKGTEEIISRLFEIIETQEKRLDFYSQYSVISYLNRMGMSDDRDLILLLKRCKAYSQLTLGKFDVSVAPLMILWGWGTEQQHVPEQEEIETLLPLVDYRNIFIYEQEGLARILPGMKLDLGGIAKGYIIDLAGNLLKEKHVMSGFINAGGDILIIGLKDNKYFWKIGIQDPLSGHNKYSCYINLRDCAVATSGNYERTFKNEGKEYCHIIDPEKGRPVRFNFSVTVISDSLEKSDALATGFFSLAPGEIMELVNKMEDVESLVIDLQNTYHLSRNIVPDTNIIFTKKKLKVKRYE